MANLLGILTGDAFRPDLMDWRCALDFDRIGKKRILYLTYHDNVSYTLSIVSFQKGRVMVEHTIKHDLINKKEDACARDAKLYAKKHKLQHVVIGFVPNDVEYLDNKDYRFDGDVEEFSEKFSVEPDILYAGADVINDNSLVSVVSHPDTSNENSIAFVSQEKDQLRNLVDAIEKQELSVIKVDLLIASMFRAVCKYAYTNQKNADIYLYDGSNCLSFAIRENEWMNPESVNFMANLDPNENDDELGLYHIWREGFDVIQSLAEVESSGCAIYAGISDHDLSAYLSGKLGYQNAYSVSKDAVCADVCFDAKTDAQASPTFDVNPNRGSFTACFPRNFYWVSYLARAACIMFLLLSGVRVGMTFYKYRGIDEVKSESAYFVGEQKRLTEQQKELLNLNEQAEDIQAWLETKPNLQYHLNRGLSLIDNECYVNRMVMNYESSTKRLSVEIELDGKQSGIMQSFANFEQHMGDHDFIRLDVETTQVSGTARTFKGVYINRAGVDS